MFHVYVVYLSGFCLIMIQYILFIKDYNILIILCLINEYISSIYRNRVFFHENYV